MEFEYIFEYVEIYENYSNIYINNIINYFNTYKQKVLNNFSTLINEFINNFKNGISLFIDNNYIEEIKKNYSSCLGYSINNLNKTIEEDKINYDKYIDYKNKMEFIELNCTSKNETIDLDDCIYNKTEIEKIIYFNKTEYLLYCHKNNYFNFSIKIFDNF